jgi:hypothetical protein
MPLKYSDKPQLNYGGHAPRDDWRQRFPSHAQPIQSAPSAGVRCGSSNRVGNIIAPLTTVANGRNWFRCGMSALG